MLYFKDNFDKTFKCDFDFKQSNTLILSGGALKCIYFLGALSRIYNTKLVNFKYFGGTSCGAVLCILLSAGYSPVEIFNEFFKQKTKNINITKSLEKTCKLVEDMLQVKNINKDVTFGGFFDITGNDVAFVTSNVSQLREEVFSRYTHRDTEIVKAMKLSCSLPVIFPITTHNNEIYADGIFFDNFPIKLCKLFKKRTKVVCITTASSYYDKRITEYYKNPDIFKILLIPDKTSKYFWLNREEKFLMFISGFNFVDENITKRKTVRRNSI